jgi:hypothetical protein
MEDFKNPIDPKTISKSPGLLPYASNVGSAIIKPIDQGRTKGLAMQAMMEQSSIQLNQIKTQVETLLKQAQAIHDRIHISESIYEAECRFKPLIGHIYYLYSKEDGNSLLSIIGPNEWGKTKSSLEFRTSVKLLADHTWEVL